MTAGEKNTVESGMTFKEKVCHAFAIGGENDILLDDEVELLNDIADKIHKRGLTAAAIPFLLFNKPLNVIGANMVQMGELVLTLKPVEDFLMRFMGPKATHERLVRTLEKRCSIEKLVEFLEARENQG
jgi:hypothetical protein